VEIYQVFLFSFAAAASGLNEIPYVHKTDSKEDTVQFCVKRNNTLLL
jgi:hypothetical protein